MSLMTNIVTRSEISRYYFCHLEYLEEHIYQRYTITIFVKKKKKKKSQVLPLRKGGGGRKSLCHAEGGGGTTSCGVDLGFLGELEVLAILKGWGCKGFNHLTLSRPWRSPYFQF